MAIGPLNVGVPESTGEVGFAPSFVVKVTGEAPLIVNRLVGFPTTQPVRAAPAGQVAAVPSAWPEKKLLTVSDPGQAREERYPQLKTKAFSFAPCPHPA
jgi:hypothetical protein